MKAARSVRDWLPTTFTDPLLAGMEQTAVIAVDPGRPTGLALLVCRGLHVDAATCTLPLPVGLADSANFVGAVDWLRAVCEAAPQQCLGDPFAAFWRGGHPFLYVAELGHVFPRRGAGPAEMTAKWRSVLSVGRVEGQLHSYLNVPFMLTEQHLYLAHEWRQGVLGGAAIKAKTELAKAFAVHFAQNHFGAPAHYPDHEAEALCLGLHHLRAAALAQGRAERTQGVPVAPAKRSRRPGAHRT